MELIVNQDLCISCGICVDTCPKIFNWNDEGKADVQTDSMAGEAENCFMEALKECPVDAIQIT